MRQAEYIWLDGAIPTQQVRSKARIVNVDDASSMDPNAYPEWGYDGSSTYQADGTDSDLILAPANVVKDPVRGGDAVLVLCEVMNPDGTAHGSNTRAALREILDSGVADEDPWVGFDQEYTLCKGERHCGFAAGAEAAPAAREGRYCSGTSGAPWWSSPRARASSFWRWRSRKRALSSSLV